jgi:uncharacterized repeat protein (TIGR01451 family)
MYLRKIILLDILLLILLLFFCNLQASYSVIEDNVTISKQTNTRNFTSSDLVEVVISVSNRGNSTIKNIMVSDDIPYVFDLVSVEKLKEFASKFIREVADLNPGSREVVTYFVTPKSGITPIANLTMPPAELSYTNPETGINHSVTSNVIYMTYRGSISSQNTPLMVLILLTISFIFGGIGSIIHWLNMKEKERKRLETKKGSYFLFGGAAGIIALATYESLSKLFSGEFLQLTIYNITLLIGTCLAVGFVPQKVVDSAVSKWIDKADENAEKADTEKTKAQTFSTKLDERKTELDKINREAKVK